MSRVVTITTYSPDSPSTKEGEAVKSFRKTNVCLALVPFKIIPLIARAGGVWESSANSRLICVCAGWDIILSHCVEFPWRCVALSWRTEPCGLVLPHRRSGASLPSKDRRLARVNHTRRFAQLCFTWETLKPEYFFYVSVPFSFSIGRSQMGLCCLLLRQERWPVLFIQQRLCQTSLSMLRVYTCSVWWAVKKFTAVWRLLNVCWQLWANKFHQTCIAFLKIYIFTIQFEIFTIGFVF